MITSEGWSSCHTVLLTIVWGVRSVPGFVRYLPLPEPPNKCIRSMKNAVSNAAYADVSVPNQPSLIPREYTQPISRKLWPLRKLIPACVLPAEFVLKHAGCGLWLFRNRDFAVIYMSMPTCKTLKSVGMRHLQLVMSSGCHQNGG